MDADASGQPAPAGRAATVSLAFPPEPRLLGTVRLVVSIVARKAGMDEEAVEDLKVAVSEACAVAVGDLNRAGRPDLIELDVIETADRVGVDATHPAVLLQQGQGRLLHLAGRVGLPVPTPLFGTALNVGRRFGLGALPPDVEPDVVEAAPLEVGFRPLTSRRAAAVGWSPRSCTSRSARPSSMMRANGHACE